MAQEHPESGACVSCSGCCSISTRCKKKNLLTDNIERKPFNSKCKFYAHLMFPPVSMLSGVSNVRQKE